MTSIAAALLALLPALPAQDPDWLIVRGEAELVAPMSYEKVGSVYLRSFTTRIVGADEADTYPAASRVVVGTPGDHALVAELARSFGLELQGEGARFQGRDYAPGTGFVLVGADPDGQGLLSLITGSDAQSLSHCFTTPVDVTQPGYTVVGFREKLASGPLVSRAGLERPVVVRLDRDFERLVAETFDWPAGDRELRIARGLAGFGHVFQALGGRSDTLPSVQGALVDADGLVHDARRAFDGVDLTRIVLAVHERCLSAFGGAPPRGPAPIVYVALDPTSATNGRNFGPDPLTGRPQVVLNLAVLGRAGNFDTVCLHECLHAFQSFPGGRAVDRGMREGTATLGTQLVDPTVSDAAALLWSEAELAAAEARRKALVAGFRRVADSTDPAVHRAWFTLGATLDAVPGAPSRSGYYVCWLACRAWLGARPGRGLGELFAATADELLAALD
jgi:hypothetical protein